MFNFPPDAVQVWIALADKTMVLWAPALALTIAYAVWEVSQKKAL